jgi:hypothetical protein
MDAKTKREQQQAKSAYAHRNDPPPNPYWETVRDVLHADGFQFGYDSFDDWRERTIKMGVSPEQALDYGSAPYTEYPRWGEFAEARIRNLADWLEIFGLTDRIEFWTRREYVRSVIEDIVRWSSEGVTSDKARAWAMIGLTPDEVEDREKPVMIIHLPS